MNRFSKILETKSIDFNSSEVDYETAAGLKKLITDSDYYDFIIKSVNGGFFFNRSLHIFGFCNFPDFHSVRSINKLLSSEYNLISQNLLSFAQDIFGNQFSFDLTSCEVNFFNIETGERKIIASNFAGWVEAILQDTEYLTGIRISEAWQSNNKLEFNQRLCPKIPFILGGKYSLDNLYATDFPNFFKTNAAIAIQVFNLPDGTEFKIEIFKKASE